MPPAVSPARASGAEPQLASMFPIKGDIDLLGESEDYTTQDDGSRSLLDVTNTEDSRMVDHYNFIDSALGTAGSLIVKEREEAQDKYKKHLAVIEGTNLVITKRRKTASRILLVSGALALALTITLFILGGF